MFASKLAPTLPVESPQVEKRPLAANTAPAGFASLSPLYAASVVSSGTDTRTAQYLNSGIFP